MVVVVTILMLNAMLSYRLFLSKSISLTVLFRWGMLLPMITMTILARSSTGGPMA